MPTLTLARPGAGALRAAAAARGRAALHAASCCRPRAPRPAPRPSASLLEDETAGGEREIWSRVLDARGEAAGRAGRSGCPGATGDIVRVGARRRAGRPARASPGAASWRRASSAAGGSDPLEPRPLAGGRRGAGRRRCARRSRGDANVLLVILDAGRAQSFGAYGYARATTPEIDRIAPRGRRVRARLHAGGLHARRDVVGLDLAVPRPPPQRGLVLRAAAEGPADARRAALGAGHPHRRLRRERRGRRPLRLRPRLRRVRRGLRARSAAAATCSGRSCRRGSQQNRDRRFFAYVHFREPHFPYDPEPPFDTRFGPDGPIPKAARRERRASSRT